MRSLLINLASFVALAAAIPAPDAVPKGCRSTIEGEFRFEEVPVGEKPRAKELDCSESSRYDSTYWGPGDRVTLEDGVLSRGISIGFYFINEGSYRLKYGTSPTNMADVGDFMVCRDGTIALEGSGNQFFRCPSPDGDSDDPGSVRTQPPDGGRQYCKEVTLAAIPCMS